MNEKILPDDIESKSLSELTDIADRLIQKLEIKKIWKNLLMIINI